MNNIDVVKLQLALKKIKCFTGKCDGIIKSNNTKWAINTFKDKYGLNDFELNSKLEQLIKWYEEQEKLSYTE